LTDKEEMNHEGRKEREERRKKKNLFTRQLVLDRRLRYVSYSVTHHDIKISQISFMISIFICENS
jgi:hypothetical protein